MKEFPTISVICPIKGLDYGLSDNVQAMKDMNYPNEWELIFVLDSEKDPAFNIVKDERVVFCGSPNGRSGKLNAMIEGLKVAKHELIAFVDSDVRPCEDTLKSLTFPFVKGDSKLGSVFGRARAVMPPKTIGDMGYSILLNGLYDFAAANYFSRNKNPSFIMGQFMVLSRGAIDDMGGLESADGQLVDDMFIGKKLHDLGYVNKSLNISVPIVHGGLSFKSFISLFRKWMSFSKSGLPWSFKFSAAVIPLIFFLGIVIGIIGMATSSFLMAAGAGLVMSSWMIINVFVTEPLDSLDFRYYFIAPLIFFLAPFVFLSLRFNKNVSWRGRSYELNKKGTLGV